MWLHLIEESFMFTIVHAASLGVAVALAAEVVAAQAPFTYREYSLPALS